jgi:two-component system secretion response regulator SsrB
MFPSPTLFHIEDDPVWGHAVQTMIRGWQEVRHVGVATTAAEGLACCRLHQPNLVLLELQLPDADGFDLAVALAGLSCAPRVLALTGRADEATLFRVGRANIAAMVWKAGPIRETLRCAVGEVLAGRRYFPADVRAAIRSIRCRPNAFFKILSERELSLLPMLCQGAADSDLALRTGLSPATVKSHRQHIMTKLDLHRAADLIRWAAEKGFVEFRQPRPWRVEASLSVKR